MGVGVGAISLVAALIAVTLGSRMLVEQVTRRIFARRLPRILPEAEEERAAQPRLHLESDLSRTWRMLWLGGSSDWPQRLVESVTVDDDALRVGRKGEVESILWDELVSARRRGEARWRLTDAAGTTLRLYLDTSHGYSADDLARLDRRLALTSEQRLNPTRGVVAGAGEPEAPE